MRRESDVKRVRVGVVGLGSMGTMHVAAFLAAGADVIAVCDLDETRLDQVATDFGVPKKTTTVEELVSADIDAVVVATPESMHLVPTQQALAAGKHVLVEKPLTTDVEEAWQIAKAASDSGLLVMPAFNLRYEPRHRIVKDWLRQDNPGRILSMYARRNRPSSLFAKYSRVHPAHEIASHDVDLVLWYAERRVERVYAVERARPGDPTPFGIWAIAELEGGCVACLETTWLVPDGSGVDRGDAFQLITEDGIAHIDLAHNGTVFWQGNDRVSRDPLLDPTSLSVTSLALRSQVEAFIQFVQGDTDGVEFSLADAVHVVEVADAMTRSARSGMPVDV
jgi:predicted dehydrogenase